MLRAADGSAGLAAWCNGTRPRGQVYGVAARDPRTGLDTRGPTGRSIVTAPTTDPRFALRDAIERELPDLRRAVEVYVYKMGLGSNREMVGAVADEVLQEVVARAMARANAYDPSRSALAWLRGFAINVIMEDRRKLFARRKNESAPPHPSNDPSDDRLDPLEQIYDLAAEQPYRLVELLDLVEPADRAVLTLWFEQKLDGVALAAALGVREGAARVRLSRALARLRDAYHRTVEMERRPFDR
jgi:RNA polymerase sigma factor (sigma-70 family)